MSTCHHVIMSSCHHAIMSSCHHVIMSTCQHVVIVSSCHRVIVSLCHLGKWPNILRNKLSELKIGWPMRYRRAATNSEGRRRGPRPGEGTTLSQSPVCAFWRDTAVCNLWYFVAFYTVLLQNLFFGDLRCCRKIGLLQFTCFCVEKNLAGNSARGEKMTNIRYGPRC